MSNCRRNHEEPCSFTNGECKWCGRYETKCAAVGCDLPGIDHERGTWFCEKHSETPATPCPGCAEREEQLKINASYSETTIQELRARVEAFEAALAQEARVSADDVLAWLKARPGSSWVATVVDVEKAIAAIESEKEGGRV